MDYVSSADHETHTKPPKKRRLLKFVRVAGVGLIIFLTGVQVGNGKIDFGNNTKNSPNAAHALDYSSVDQLYETLRDNYDGGLDATKLQDGLKSGLVKAAGDPYTEYFNREDAKTFNEQLSGSFTGIGAELGTNAENNIVIVSPLAGFPAEKAGLKAGDIIAAIDGEATADVTVSKAVQKIRGPADTTVKLTIIRGSANAFDVNITRAKITIASVESKVEGQIGYLKITQFTDDTTKLAQKAAQDFKQQNVKAIVLDLRGNPGGYLSGAVDISSLWLDSGKTVVSERRGEKVLTNHQANGNNLLKGLPTIVIINSGSASASEIVAGALRDNAAASLVGEKSFGKGSVQKVESLNDGSELKVTIARWYTPAGKNIDKEGITPEVQVAFSDEDQKAGRDPQKDKAYELVRAKIQ